MYTKGIRKILILDGTHYGHIDRLIKIAKTTGHKAVLHNGVIWVKASERTDGWTETPFDIDDFKGD